MAKFIGIDLGQKGSLTVRSGKLRPTWTLHSFWGRFGGSRLRTLTNSEICNLIIDSVSSPEDTYVAIEHPVFVPQNGKKAISGLFQNFGFFLGVLETLEIKNLWLPKPVQWKKVGSFQGSDKALMVKHAIKLAPSLPEIDTETADSVLIAECCYLHFNSLGS